MEVPRLGVESELQLLACTIAAAMLDPSHFCDLYHSSGKHQILLFFYFLFLFFCFLGLLPLYTEVPRLGVELNLQLLAYTTAPATPDLSRVCALHHSSQQCGLLDPLSEARDQTHNSWFLVGFVSASPRWELPVFFFFYPGLYKLFMYFG